MISTAQLSSAEEDYLLAIARTDGLIKTSELAKKLEVSDPSVTLMIAKLSQKGLVVHQSHRPIGLTAEGQAAAVRLIRRHRLIELFLTTTLNYGWEEVHEEAHRLEHVVSEKFIERLDRLLGHPNSDPHGARIPDSSGSTMQDDRFPLTSLKVGGLAQVVEVDDENPQLLTYVGSLGLYPGVKFQLMERAPFDGPSTLKLRGKRISLGQQVVAAIRVKEIV